MGRGQWTRWGRGMCEGWSIEIGIAFHGSVVRRDRSGELPIWTASINSTGLGEFLEREIAMHRVEELVEASMVLVLHDWELYRSAKAKR
jgi:hypothetical protein